MLDEETTRLENGLSVLATVGATAPFVGLFGTVWGVYHALVAIGMSGAGTLDKVAGPVGEALIMTGLGLAVAIPAVMGYNWLTRSNRVMAARLDAFAYELHTFVSMGQPLGNGVGNGVNAEAPPANVRALALFESKLAKAMACAPYAAAMRAAMVRTFALCASAPTPLPSGCPIDTKVCNSYANASSLATITRFARVSQL